MEASEHMISTSVLCPAYQRAFCRGNGWTTSSISSTLTLQLSEVYTELAYWDCFWLLAFAVALLSSESFLQAFIVVQGLFTERNLVQALSLPLINVSSLDVFRARSISFDGPPTEAWYGRQSTHHSPLPVASPRRTSFTSASWTRASFSIRSVSHRDVPSRLSRGSTCACPRARRGHVHRRHPVLCRRSSFVDRSLIRWDPTVP